MLSLDAWSTSPLAFCTIMQRNCITLHYRPGNTDAGKFNVLPKAKPQLLHSKPTLLFLPCYVSVFHFSLNDYTIYYYYYLKHLIRYRSWSNDSAVKKVYCSRRRSSSGARPTSGSSQRPVIPVPEHFHTHELTQAHRHTNFKINYQKLSNTI